MRILKVHNYYLQPGGEDTVFQSETSLLRAHGYDVIEYLEDNRRIESMSRTSVAMQTIWSQSSYRKMIHVLDKQKPDVVHFHNTFPLISPSAYYACRKLKIPVLQTLDNQRLICPSANFYRNGQLCLDCFRKTPPWPSILHACYHGSRLHTAIVTAMLTTHRWMRTWKTMVDVFLCSSHFYRDLFERSGLPAGKLVVMPHFVQADPQPHAIKGSVDYALYIGRLDPEKGIRTLLEAWTQLEIPLKIRGDGQLEQEAREFVNSKNTKSVEFIGRLGREELSTLIRNARFLVVPSEGYYETFGMVIIEAYARGVPVLASRIGVAIEMVIDGETGLYFTPGDAADLADKAQRLWEDPLMASKFGDNALKLYHEKFTPEQCYHTLLGVYKRVMRSR